MKRKQKSKSAKPAEKDLFGEPLKPHTQPRKIVKRPEGRGFDIAVRKPDGAAYLRLNAFYATRAAAAKALRESLRSELRESRHAIWVVVWRRIR